MSRYVNANPGCVLKGMGMNLVKFGFLVLVFSILGPHFSKAAVDVRVDLTNQRMTVTSDEGVVHQWAISSGRSTHRTPTGRYRAQWLDRTHRSSRYQNAPMPYSVFFRGNYAIHGTNQVRALGQPASHGCIRLHTANAAKLFALVQKHGLKQTSITISGGVKGKVANNRLASPKTVPGKAKVTSGAPHDAPAQRTQGYGLRLDGAGAGPPYAG